MASNSAHRSGKSKSSVLILLAFAALSLASCETTERIHDTMDQQAETTRQALDNVTSQGQAQRYNPLVVTNKIWAGDSAVRIQRGIPLPPKYETPHGFTLVAAEPMSLADIASAITVQTGIPVHVEDDKGVANIAPRIGQQAGNSSFAAAQMMRGGFNQGAGAGGGSSSPTMPVAYEGPLSGLLDHASGYFGVAWHYDGGTVELSHFETRTFTIEALPGTQKLSSDMTGGATSGGSGGGSGGGGSSGGSSGGGSSGGSSGGGSSGGSGGGAGGSATSSATMELKADVDVKYWEELKEILTSMLNGEGMVVLSPSLGTITVTTTPEVMHSIASYITQENERMSRQIAIDIEVYTLGLEHGVDFNVSFTAFLRKMGTFGPISIADATGTVPTSIDNLTSGLVTGNVAILNQSAGHNNVSDIFSTLSSISNTTRQAQFPMVTLNNRPVSVRVGEDQQYVCGYNSNTQSTASTVSSSNVIVTPTVCTLNLGFSIQLAPRLLDDGRILLQYALTSNDLVGTPTLFNSVCGSGTNANSCSAASNGVSSGSVELVNTNTRSFSQQSVLRSGSTLIIGGVNEKSLGQNSNGVGNAYNYIFGGGSSNDQTDTMILIAITPQVIELPRAEHG